MALVLTLLACGALSFNYSRDRLGGMAVPFYALAAGLAVGDAVRRASGAPTTRRWLATGGLVLLGCLWGMRTVGTVETLRGFSARNEVEWMTQGPPRREEFAERPVYLSIMSALRPQGTTADAPRPMRYPGWLAGAFAPLPPPRAPRRSTLADAIQQHDIPRAFAIVRAGQHPDLPIVVNDPLLTGGRDRPVSPLWWAVGMRDANAVLMLIDLGARIDRSEGRSADCLADQLGETAIAALLRRYGSPPAAGCGVSGGAPPASPATASPPAASSAGA